MTTTIAMFMPTLNASSSGARRRAAEEELGQPLLRPAPPGVAGNSVASESTTWASSALWIVACTPNAFRKKKSEAIRKTHEIACGRITPTQEARPVARGSRSRAAHARENSSTRRRAQKKRDHAATTQHDERDPVERSWRRKNFQSTVGMRE